MKFTIFILVVPSTESNILFVCFHAKGARARVYFQTTYYLYFIAQITRTPFLFFVNITKDKPPSRKNVQLSESISMYASIYWLICSRNC